MARPTNRLSARSVQTAGTGYHADGGGLYLLVTDAGTASWVFRYARDKRKREMGLGSAQAFTLAEARERAREQRKLLADGLDPIDHRSALRGARSRTWGEAVADYIDAHRAGWKTPQQAQQWENTLATYGPAASMPLRSVSTGVVVECLTPAWSARTETATRVRGRIERVWDAERVKGNVAGDNPARWRGHLEHLLPKPSKVARVKHHAAMPWAEVPSLMNELRMRDSRSARALRFLILTAARTGEVTGMPWAEDRGETWDVPAERMKAGEAHIVPLVAEARSILDALPRDRPPFALSENAMLYLLQRDPPKGLARPYTVHGFRSSFTDWARDNAHAPDHVIDAALAHKVGDEVKAAYGRSKLLALRRELMEKWAAFLA